MARKFTSDHEWLDLEGDVATVGITNYAQDQLGDVVFVELPQVGRAAKKGEPIAVVESVKAASDVFSPLDGEIVAVNEALANEPASVNSDAEGGAWFFKMRLSSPSDLDALLDRDAYDKLTR